MVLSLAATVGLPVLNMVLPARAMQRSAVATVPSESDAQPDGSQRN
jgi:hypothetical protein